MTNILKSLSDDSIFLQKKLQIIL